ncbi:MAG: hypothetical protein E7582_06935 [Ruminococcaceae bacterium]|nr:hypothetical protein [Oscillospiraceae bacterium]
MSIKDKFLSRKFWAGLAGFIAPILLLFKLPENDVTTVTALITSCGSLIAYIFAETSVDMIREKGDSLDSN